MKILQSPYYQPRKLLSASSEPPYTVQLIEDNLQYASKYNPFESLLDDIFPGVHVGNHDMVIRNVERPMLEFILQQANGNQTVAADMLGINRNTLRRKLTDYELL